MDTIKNIKCYLCEKDIKVGFYLEQGNILKNYPFYEMYLIHRDLSETYFGEYKRSDGIKLMNVSQICEECFKKLLNKDIIKENEKLKNRNKELEEEKYNLIREINELSSDMDQLM